MKDSLQDVYAKYLQHADYGYPLRIPEPMNALPQNYQENGLQIGDVGVVDNQGQFRVLFNICRDSDNILHDARGLPENFEPVGRGDVNFIDNAIPACPIHSHGIEQNLNEPRLADYEFDSSTPAGAILILPHGASSTELLSTNQFREVATKNAHDWYKFAEKHCNKEHLARSLYLITGFYKARSWSLCSFNNPTNGTRKILAKKDDNYILKCTKSFVNPRHGDSRSVNQTVFITGFKITVGGLFPDPVVLEVTKSETAWSALVHQLKACLKRIRGTSSGGHNPRGPIDVEHSPQLSQPFHPSNAINSFLLKKKPDARVAITHDTQWMDMIKGGLTREHLIQEDRLETFLTQHYTIAVAENTAVFLQGEVDGTTNSVVDPRDKSPKLEMSDPSTSELGVSPSPTPELEISHPSTPELEASSPLTSELEFPPPPTLPLDNPRIVITRIRAQNIHLSLKRIPVGFYVLVRFDGAQRKTRNKSILLNDSGIEWEDEILLPSKMFDTVQFTVYASFELEPMLGSGEVLYTSESCVEELVGGTYLITYSPAKLGTAIPHPSLLVTLGCWYSNPLAASQSGDDSNLDSDQSSDFARKTDLGREALLRYYSAYRREDLENAVQHFECAWHNCPLTHRCRAVVLVNLANAKFISHQIDPTSADIDDLISFYRQALNLRDPGHPDRPAALLQLAQALSFRYEKQRCNKSIVDVEESPVADEIESLMAEVGKICHGDSFESRAAGLVLQTLKRHQVLARAVLVELEELVSELERSVEMPPLWHFDRPYRMINLSAALRKLFELTGDLDHLEKSISVMKEAVQLISDGHFDKPWMLLSLGDALFVRFTRGGDVTDLDRSISMIEDTLMSTPDGHPAVPWMATRLGAALLIRFTSGNASDIKMSISMTGSVVHLVPNARLDQPTTAGTLAISDLTDLEQAISMHRNAVGLLVDGNSHKPGCLANLACSLFIRFRCLSNRSDLEEAILRHEDAVILSPNGHSDIPACLNNLTLALTARFQPLGEVTDFLNADEYPIDEKNEARKADLSWFCERLGDQAMYHGKHDSAIVWYSVSLGLFPESRVMDSGSEFAKKCLSAIEAASDTIDEAVTEDLALITRYPPGSTRLLVKRSKAKALRKLWDDALKDADQAIDTDRLCSWGYERRYVALHALHRYQEATKTFGEMITMMGESDDPSIRQLRTEYVAHAETIKKIDDQIGVIREISPLVLIYIKTGRLCNAAERIRIFKSDPIFHELVFSMLKALDNERSKEVVARYFRYVMFSHTWEGKEPTYQDVAEKSVYELDAQPLEIKLRRFCKMVQNDSEGYLWAWSDTCCINKTIETDYRKSIRSMYNWYKESALTIVLLAAGSAILKHNRWMKRAWTLQELLSPKSIRFYDRNWELYQGDMLPNHKESPRIMQELAEAVDLTRDTLVDFSPKSLSIRAKLRLASTREATEKADVAYALIGIFSSDLIPEYRDPEDALGLLLEEIVHRERDAKAVLDWVGKSSQFNSCLPAHISVYQHPPYISPHIPEDAMETRVAQLRDSLPRQNVTMFFENLSSLGSIDFTRRRLSLPCITFSVTTLDEVLGQSKSEAFRTASSPQHEVILVYPWIRDLLAQVDRREWDNYTRALRLVVHLEQPFRALLLAKQSFDTWKRVATDTEFFIPTRKIASLGGISARMLDIR